MLFCQSVTKVCRIEISWQNIFVPLMSRRGQGKSQKRGYSRRPNNDEDHGSFGNSSVRGHGSERFRGQSSENLGRGRGSRGGSRHPPHLKGKEIGLYYASLNKDSAKKTRSAHEGEFENDLEIDLREDHQQEISSLLEQLRANNPGQSSRSTSSASNKFMENFQQNLRENKLNTWTDLPKELLGDIGERRREPKLDTFLQEELQSKYKNERFNRLQTFTKMLPAFKTKSDILQLIERNQVVVISGETGCGKTTQIPQYILESCILKGNGSLCNILCSQPRRMSATSVAERIADERGERVGEKSVGYSIRLESRLPPRLGGTITLCTTGVIFQYLKLDPVLSKVSHIVVDEVHERDILSDFLLTMLKDIIVKRPEVKVIIMSATLNSEKFSKYFGNCPMFNIPGMTFPVDEYYLEDVIEMTRFQFPEKFDVRDRGNMKWKHAADTKNKKRQYDQFMSYHLKKMQKEGKYFGSTIRELAKMESEDINYDLIQRLLEYICESDKGNGAVLIFVPGWEEISKINSQLETCGRFPSSAFKIIPLHSMMPTVNQRDVFNRPPQGQRKIVIATNIAETSITIDDIVFIVDCGKIKISNYDLERNVETLDTEWVSHANAKQRKGRAGRVQKGVCYHLFSKARLSSLEEFKKPEILRKRLEETVLQIKMLRLGQTQRFLNLFQDPPSSTAINLGITRLNQLHALDSDENLTPLGFHLAQLPMDPQTGKMILMGAIFLCVDPVFTIAASLSFKDPFYMPLGKEKLVDRIKKELSGESKSDHIAIVRAVEGYERALLRNCARDYCYKNFLSQNTMKLLHDLKQQFAQYLYKMKFLPSQDVKHPSVNVNSDKIALIKGVSCAGMYPNIAYVTNKSKHKGFPVVRTVEDGRVYIHPKSVNSEVGNFESPFLIYHEKMKTKCINLYDTTMISAFPFVFFGGKIDFLWAKKSGSLGVDGLMRFQCNKSVYELMQGLRDELDILFDGKICNPGPTNWSDPREGALLRTVAKVITSEYRYVMSEIDVSSDETDSDSDYD